MQARFLSKLVESYHTMKTQSALSVSQSQTESHKQIPLASASETTTTARRDTKNTSKVLFRRDSETMTLESGVEEEIRMPLDMGSHAFCDTEMWEKMFAEAGFRLNDGVFMPEAVGR